MFSVPINPRPSSFLSGFLHSSDLIKFTDEEKEKMRKLPHKEYLLDKAMEKTAYMGLVDVLFGYAYNVRCSEGEDNVSCDMNFTTGFSYSAVVIRG